MGISGIGTDLPWQTEGSRAGFVVFKSGLGGLGVVIDSPNYLSEVIWEMLGGGLIYPLVNYQFASENGNRNIGFYTMIYPLNMVMFHSYVNVYQKVTNDHHILTIAPFKSE